MPKRKLFPTLEDLAMEIGSLIARGNTDLAIETIENASDFNEEITENAGHFLEQAVLNNNLNMVVYLLGFIGDINAIEQDGNDEPALHTAINLGYIEIAHLLINSGANVNAISELGFSPLHIATMNNNVHIITLLLDNGANINAADLNGNNALNLANNPLVIALLQGRGAIIAAANDSDSEEESDANGSDSEGEDDANNLVSDDEGEDDANDFISEDEDDNNQSPVSKIQEEAKEDSALNPALKALTSLLETYKEFGAPEALIKMISSRIETLKENAAPYMNIQFVQSAITKGLLSAIEQANSNIAFYGCFYIYAIFLFKAYLLIWTVMIM